MGLYEDSVRTVFKHKGKNEGEAEKSVINIMFESLILIKLDH